MKKSVNVIYLNSNGMIMVLLLSVTSFLIILSKEVIKLLYDLPNINFLDYYQVRADINNFLITNLMNEITEIKRPYIPAHQKIPLKSKTGCKDLYWEMNRQNLNMDYQQK